MQALKLIKEYERYELANIDAELRKQMQAIQGRLLLNQEEKINPEEMSIALDYANQKSMAREMFLIENDYAKAKELFSIWYEDFDGNIVFDDYGEWLKETGAVFNDFFQKHKGITIM